MVAPAAVRRRRRAAGRPRSARSRTSCRRAATASSPSSRSPAGRAAGCRAGARSARPAAFFGGTPAIVPLLDADCQVARVGGGQAGAAPSHRAASEPARPGHPRRAEILAAHAAALAAGRPATPTRTPACSCSPPGSSPSAAPAAVVVVVTVRTWMVPEPDFRRRPRPSTVCPELFGRTTCVRVSSHSAPPRRCSPWRAARTGTEAALPPVQIVEQPAASAGGACILWDYAFIEQKIGVKFTVAAADQVDDTSTCVVQTEADAGRTWRCPWSRAPRPTPSCSPRS